MNEAGRTTVFFPGAGSFGREFRALAEALKPASWIIKYPGRYGRGFGIPAKSFDGVAQVCAEQIVSRMPSRPVLFGHSFGAYVAYATALKLQEAGSWPAALVVAGASAPRHLEVPEQATGTHSDVAMYLDRIDPRALADAPSDDWREIIVEAVVNDLRLLKQFDVLLSTNVHCPILAIRGETDPLTSNAAVVEWEHYTDTTFSLHTFPGGHSDFFCLPACISLAQGILDSFSQDCR